jgi:uncharacterized protein
MIDLTNRYEFLGSAILFEGSLIGVAGLLGRWLDVDPLGQFAWSFKDVGWGALAALPMLLLFRLACRTTITPFRRIHQFLLTALGPSLAACRWYDLLLLGAVAGIGEELLFRGVLHPWLGVFGSNVAFGLAHAITPLYAILAGGMGAYLGFVLDSTGNVLAAIVTHGLYDFLAFLMVAREFLRQSPPEANRRSTPE